MKPAGTSPYATRDAQHHAEALGRVEPDDVHEFYHPFVMLDDLPLELVRVVNPTYGALDMILLLEPRPIQLYCDDKNGAKFMRERFPNAHTFPVPAAQIRLVELDRGETMLAELRSPKGPIRELSLVINADPDAEIRTERYESHDVWDSPLECHGIDLRQAATCRGTILWDSGKRDALSTPATIFRGSYGKITSAQKVKEGSARRHNTR